MFGDVEITEAAAKALLEKAPEFDIMITAESKGIPLVYEMARQAGRKVIVAAGGVAANSIIRGDLEAACRREGCRLYLPPLKLCGDNGAMIGAQGYYEYLAGHTAGMELNAYATRDISQGA